MTKQGAEFRNLQLVIVRARMAFRRYVQRTLKEHGFGITFEMLQVISCLWRDQGIAQQTLAERIVKDKASLSNLLNNLERKGYISRKEDAADRRNKLVYLTPEGEALWQRLLPIFDEVYTRAEEAMGLARIRNLTAELEEMHNILENA